MIKKLRPTRLLLQGSGGTLHKLCSIADCTDKHAEPYFKIMPVEFLQGATLTTRTGMREIDGRMLGSADTQPPIQCVMESLTYHYIGGIRHLRTVDGKYLSEHRGFPKLQEADERPVLICRYILDTFDAHTKPYVFKSLAPTTLDGI